MSPGDCIHDNQNVQNRHFHLGPNIKWIPRNILGKAINRNIEEEVHHAVKHHHNEPCISLHFIFLNYLSISNIIIFELFWLEFRT